MRPPDVRSVRAATRRKRTPLAARAAILLLFAGVVVEVVREDASSPPLYPTLRGNRRWRRRLANSLNLGGGACQWKPPSYEVPADLDFHKTFVAGFPSGDKRMAFIQMEALAGFSAKDEWDFVYEGPSNHPFIKGNYPHHEGMWGWGAAADQLILMVPNIRRAMVEYHDIIWDLAYATTWEEATLLSDNLFVEQPSLEDYYAWRDSRVEDEVHWYGWFIDYWMEGGLLRDVFSHRMTTPDHWNDLTIPHHFTRDQLKYDNYVKPGTVIAPSYDPHCENRDITEGCEPVEVISVDRLRDQTAGAAETAKIANVLMRNNKTGQYVIAQEAWECIWEELIISKKGPPTTDDRPGYESIYHDINFSADMLLLMIDELNRLITKYSGSEWKTKKTANVLVEVLNEHLVLVEGELEEINTGVRVLRQKDFLGSEQRARMPSSKNTINGELEKEDHSSHFVALEQKRFELKQQRMKQAARSRMRSETSSETDFLQAIADALRNIRTLESAGRMNRETARDLAERVRKVAKVVFPKGA